MVDTPAQSPETGSAKKADLVLEGGGVKGIGLLGAVISLSSAGYTFPRVAGTSAGAIVGALVAASVAAGRPLDRLVEVMRQLDYRQFRDETPLDHLGVVGKGTELLVGRGIYKGDFLVHWLDGQLKEIGVETFGDLKIADRDDPGTGLRAEQRYRLVVMTSDISRGQLVRLPWDCGRYGIDADLYRIVDAVRASMSIPFFFKPSVLRGKHGESATVVDGGMLSNFPIECFDRPDGQSRWPTFGVKLSARPAATVRAMATDNTFELGIACLQTLLGAHDQYHLDSENVSQRTIFVDTLGVSGTNFDIDRATQDQLYANGAKAATDFTASWPPRDFTPEGRWVGDPGGLRPASAVIPVDPAMPPPEAAH